MQVATIGHLTYKCRLLITFADSLDPDQARQIVGPYLDPNPFMVFPEVSFEKNYFEKKQQTTKIMKNYPVGKEINKEK